MRLSRSDDRAGPLSPVQQGIVLAALVVAIAVMRLHTYDEPLERDLTLYSLIGHELLSGRQLYSDLWDFKPPGVFVAYAAAEVVAGYGRSSIYAMNVVAAVATLFGIWSCARLLGGQRAALVAAAAWTFAAGDLFLQANQPNTEVFLNALIVWGFYALLRGDRARYLATAGVLFAVASLFKHVACFPAAFLAVGCAVELRGAGKAATRLRPVVWIAAIGAAAWVLVLCWFAMVGSAPDFVRAVLVTNAFYARVHAPQTVIEMFGSAGPSSLLLLVLAACMLPAFFGTKSQSRERHLLIWFAAGTLIAVIAPRHAFPHYLQLLLPPLIIGTAVFLGRFTSRRGAVVTIVALVSLLAYEGRFYLLPPEKWSEMKYGSIFVDAERAATSAEPLVRGKRVYVCGNEPVFYLRWRTPPPSGVIMQDPLFIGPQRRELTQRVMNDVARVRPEFVVLNESEPRSKDVARWIEANYAPLPSAQQPFILLRRKSGR